MPRTAALALAASLSGALAPAGGLGAQTAAWSFRLVPQVDLWFHAVAITGFEGFGTLPLYRPGYAITVRREREVRGIPATRLESTAPRYLDAFTRDSAMELVHFLPLYFAAADPSDMLAVLAQLPDQGGDLRGPTPRTAQFGARAVTWALKAPQERRALSAFAAAAGDEWTEAYGAEWRRQAARGDTVARAAEARWRRDFEPALRPFLARYRLEGGVIALSGSVGLDGRLVQGSSRATDNFLVVGLPPGNSVEDILFSVVREFCFPPVRAVLPSATSAQRVADERVSGNAAVRCGDLVLARHLPATRAAYRRFWLSAAGAPPDASLDRVFPVPASQLVALARAIEPAP